MHRKRSTLIAGASALALVILPLATVPLKRY